LLLLLLLTAEPPYPAAINLSMDAADEWGCSSFIAARFAHKAEAAAEAASSIAAASTGPGTCCCCCWSLLCAADLRWRLGLLLPLLHSF
jgi:hypothetical protein